MDTVATAPETTMSTLQYEQPNQQLLIRRATSRLMLAEKFVIENDAQLTLAAEELSAVKAAMKELEGKRMAITRPLDAAKKAVMDLFRQPLEVLERAEGIYKQRMGTYRLEQERKAAEERRRAEEAAAAERKRIEQEAAALEAAGDADTAAIVKHTADMVVAAPPATQPAKVAGLSFREKWGFEILDASKLPREFLIPNEAAIRGVVNAMKGETRIPGVRVFRDDVVASR